MDDPTKLTPGKIRMNARHSLMFGPDIAVWIRDDFAYVADLMLRKIPENQPIPDHAPLVLTREMAQVLMDDLWDCGLRPSEGTGSAGAMAATEKHLADMRRLVFRDR